MHRARAVMESHVYVYNLLIYLIYMLVLLFFLNRYITYVYFECCIFQTDAIRAITEEKFHTMQLMVEQERRYVDQIRQDLASSNSTKLQLELDSAVKRLAKLEQQLDDLKAGKVRLDIGISVFKNRLIG